MGNPAVAVSSRTPEKIDAKEEKADAHQARWISSRLGEPADELADEQGGNEIGGCKEDAAEDGEGHKGALALQEMVELFEKIHRISISDERCR